MEFYDVLRNRHSVRKFQDKDMDKAKVRDIVEAGIKAPSAGNLQSYRICIVRSKSVREALVPACEYQDFIAEAPLLLVFCADLKRSESRYGQRGFELFATQDATIAAAYCQLAATAEGLSSVWVGSLDQLEVSRVLHLMSFEVPVAMLAIGHPAEAAGITERRPAKEIVREY
ncbi:MAG: nitroreductase family protein [Candidatus Micrarchaeota archaeon]